MKLYTEEIYNLELHDSINIYEGGEIVVTRVPGGWIYKSYVFDVGITSVFIPYNEEFLCINN